jgi:hypothetical protein
MPNVTGGYSSSAPGQGPAPHHQSSLPPPQMPQSGSPVGGAPPAGPGAEAGGRKGPATFAEMGIPTAKAENKGCDYVIFFFVVSVPASLSVCLPFFFACLLAFLSTCCCYCRSGVDIVREECVSLSHLLMVATYSEHRKKKYPSGRIIYWFVLSFCFCSFFAYNYYTICSLSTPVFSHNPYMLGQVLSPFLSSSFHSSHIYM